MGQVNVNTPGDPEPREGGYGAGLIVGIIVAIIVIVLLVWLLVIQPGARDTPGNGDPAAPPDNGEQPPENGEETPGGWRITPIA